MLKKGLRECGLRKVKRLLQKAFTPITIMLIPHSDGRPLRFKIPSIGILLSIVLWVTGMAYVFHTAVNTAEYNKMKIKLNYYSSQFLELRSTMYTLRETESEFQKLFKYKSKDKILENLDTSDTGSLDLRELKQQIKITMENSGDIKDYLSKQRDIYLATPKGWPTHGHITSPYGYRINPVTDGKEFHSGLDIAAEPGEPVRATADGIVIFAGWSGNNGNLVAIEHGLGFRTYYAHNRKVVVKVGQKVKRGQVISYVGSTGRSTGPHVHYEIWHEGKRVNPKKYIKGRS
jgi:murein DD-endopeptidase MepM/ murein hydrolase activator NlpD